MINRNDIPKHLFPIEDSAEQQILADRLDLEAQDSDNARAWQEEADKESGRDQLVADLEAGKFTKVGLYARHQILEELERMGHEILTVSGRPASPEDAKTQCGITHTADAGDYRQAIKNLKERGVRSEYAD